MGTNFYARIIPLEEDKRALKEKIDNNDFTAVREAVEELYESFRPYHNEDPVRGTVHLGKRSAGWKFLWNPNIYQIRNGHMEWTVQGVDCKAGHYVPEPDTPYYVYPLTKKGIKAFIDRSDVEVWDEYGDKWDKDKFFKEALSWTTWKGEEAFDADSYHKAHPEEHEYSSCNDYTDFLESLGYKLSSTKSDFYSDGLRFATSTDFC